MLSKLKVTLQAHKRLREAYLASCEAIWSQLQIDEPEIAATLRALGWSDTEIALWASSPLVDGASPAELVADGQSDVVANRIFGALHGHPT